ncbi:hypothetical protein AALB64_17445 [Lachnospiraceae bacterium 45-P1]
MLIWFLAVNFVLAMLYAVIRGIHREDIGMAFFFIFLPGLGFIIYFLPGLLRAFLEKAGVDREAVLTHAFKIDRQPEHPDVREALNVVPVEDAMAVSGNTEKRALLLGQLKKNLKENYRILLAAEQDEDSESAHYVAAAKMEIYRLGQTRWLECRRDYEQEPGDPDRYHAACGALMEMLSSGVLSAKEQSAYQKRLCSLVQGQIDAGKIEVSQKEYVEYLGSLVELGQYADAENLWKRYADRMRSEAAYEDMLKMFYQTGERQKYEGILDDLRKNKQVRLSPKGLEQLRYWMSRLAGASMDN